MCISLRLHYQWASQSWASAPGIVLQGPNIFRLKPRFEIDLKCLHLSLQLSESGNIHAHMDSANIRESNIAPLNIFHVEFRHLNLY